MNEKDGSLTISNIDVYDDGEYRCRAFPKSGRFETKISLEVNGAPKQISIGHNQEQKEDISGKTFEYRAGQKDLRFKCNVGKSRPKAKISWIHNGNPLEESKDHDLKILDSNIVIIKVLHASHAGEYQCEASNEFGSVKAGFKIDVHCKTF
jgi:Immunoglobulin I-set domain